MDEIKKDYDNFLSTLHSSGLDSNVIEMFKALYLLQLGICILKKICQN